MSERVRERVRFGSYEMDLETAEIWREGEPLDLPPQPSRVLALLVARAGSLVDRDELRRRIWGDSWLEWEAGLHQAIRRIRVALGDSAGTPRFVETVPRRGYRFIAPVESIVPPRPRFGAAPRLSTSFRSLSAVAVTCLALLAPVPPKEPTRVGRSIDPEAIRLQREGVHLLETGRIDPAIERFEQAAELAPNWAEPWSARAEAELARPGEDRVTRARLALEAALARDSENARAWRQLAQLRMWEEWDWVGGRRALERALALAPESAEVWQAVAALETVLGRWDQALVAARRAVALDPISTALRVDLGWTLYYAGELDAAVGECSRSLELDPGNPPARQCLVQSLLAQGRDLEAGAILASAAAPPASGGSRTAPSKPGAEPLSDYFQRQLAAQAAGPTCGSAAAAALPKLVLGDPSGALDALRMGAEEGRGWEVPFARVDPLFRELRAEPEFAAVERALGL